MRAWVDWHLAQQILAHHAKGGQHFPAGHRWSLWWLLSSSLSNKVHSEPSVKFNPQAEARFMKTHHNLVQFRSKKKSVRVQEKRAPVLKSKVLLSFGFFVSCSLQLFHTSKVSVHPLSWQELQVFCSFLLQSPWRNTCLRGMTSLFRFLLQLWTQWSWHQ